MQPQTPNDWQQSPQVDQPPVEDAPMTDTASAEPDMAYDQEYTEDEVYTDELSADDDQLVEAADLHEDDGDEDLIRWEGVEYIQRHRPMVWYVVLAVVTIALILVAIYLMKSWTFALLIPVMASALVVYTFRPPTHIQYTLSRKGLHVNDKLQPYDQFRAFSVVTHEGHNMVQLIPRKRFGLGEMVYFPDEVGEVIVDMLAARLPMKETKPDIFDRIISSLKL